MNETVPMLLPAGSEPPSTPLISLKDVDKAFDGGTLALSKLNLTIHDGEFVAMIGPSGCGKSTILRLMAGLEQPSSGSVETAFSRATHASNIAYVFQEPTLMPWASVFDNVWLPLRLQGVSRNVAEPAVKQALATVGLTDVATAYPGQLSGGMKMRVSISRASVTRPRVLLMDEPFAALDEVSRGCLTEDLLKHWEKTGVSIVLVTHNVAEALYLSQRVLVMSSRPTTILEDVASNFAHPREPALRLSQGFLEASAQLSATLSGAAVAPNKAAA